jgi:hypothetical protein
MSNQITQKSRGFSRPELLGPSPVHKVIGSRVETRRFLALLVTTEFDSCAPPRPTSSNAFLAMSHARSGALRISQRSGTKLTHLKANLETRISLHNRLEGCVLE